MKNGTKKSYKAPELRRFAKQDLQDLEVRLISDSGLGRRIAVFDEFSSRDLRRRDLPDEWQSDEAWEILIELYHRQFKFEFPSIKQVQHAVTAPESTTLRRLERLCKTGWVIRFPSQSDLRVVRLRLAPSAIDLLERWADARAQQLAAVTPHVF